MNKHIYLQAVPKENKPPQQQQQRQRPPEVATERNEYGRRAPFTATGQNRKHGDDETLPSGVDFF